MTANDKTLLCTMKSVVIFLSIGLSGCSVDSTADHVPSCDAGKLKAQSGDFAGAMVEWEMLGYDSTAKERLRAVMNCLAETGITKDVSGSAQWIMNAAQDSVPDAQMFLGMLYISGAGVQKDLDEGRRWLGLASRNGVKQASDLLELLKDVK